MLISEPEVSPPSQAAIPMTWRPAYLRRRVLLLFAASYCVLIASLEFLYQFSQRKNGLASAKENQTYLWTYGPTAVFTLLAALWARVEYQTKHIAPWMGMFEFQATPPKSVLLDYISINRPKAIWNALRNQHYPVAVSAICSLLFTILVIFSTGLLTSASTVLHHNNVSMILTRELNLTSTELDPSNTLPYMIMRGALQDLLSYPDGITSELAYETFDCPGVPLDTRLEASVKSFSASLECQPAKLVVASFGKTLIDFGSGVFTFSMQAEFQFEVDDCKISMNLDNPVGLGSRTMYDRVPSENVVHWVFYRNSSCEDSALVDQQRIVVSGIKFQATPVDAQTEQDTSGSTNYTVLASTSLICKPSYVVNTASVSKTKNSTLSKYMEVQLLPGTQYRTLGEVHPGDIAQWQATLQIRPEGYRAYDQQSLPSLYPSTGGFPQQDLNMNLPLVEGVLLAGETFSEPSQFLNSSLLERSANKYFQTLAALMAHSFFMQATSSPLNGSAFVSDNRLFVGVLSTRVLEVTLGLLAGFLLALFILLQQKPISSKKMEHGLGMLGCLANSPSFLKLLHGQGASNMKALQHHFEGYLCKWNANTDYPSITITLDADEEPILQKSLKKVNHIKWWVPWSLRLTGRLILCSLLVVLITAFEITLYISLKNDGLGDAVLDGYVHYTWSYIPALTMVVTSLWLATMDFDTRCLGPFSKLCHGSTTSQSLCQNYLDSTAMGVVFKAYRSSNAAVLTVAIASVIASLLTTAVNGVFQTRNVPSQFGGSLESTTNFSHDLSGGNNTGTTVIALVFQANISYPAWTYEEYAFPIMQLSQLAIPIDQIGTIEARVPALTSDLLCDLIPETGFSYQFYENSTSIDPYSQHQGLPLLQYNISSGPCQVESAVEELNPNAPYFGKQATADGFACPAPYMWGSFQQGQIKFLQFMQCTPAYYEVDVDLTLVGSSLQIDTSNPPVPDSSTRRPFSLPKAWLETYVNANDFPLIPSANELDAHFSAAICDPKGIAVKQLGDPNSTLKVVDGIRHAFKEVVAQQINNKKRIPVDETHPGQSFNATITRSVRLRLIQDKTGTRITQGMLAMILVLVITSEIVTKSRQVLSKNPCSIAAMASLFADSSLVTDYLETESGNDQQLMQKQACTGEIELQEEHTPKEQKYVMGWFNHESRADGKLWKIEKMNDETMKSFLSVEEEAEKSKEGRWMSKRPWKGAGVFTKLFG